MRQKIILAGGSGFLGQALAEELIKRNYDIFILSRSPKKSEANVQYEEWDGKSLGNWINHFSLARNWILVESLRIKLELPQRTFKFTVN